MNKKTGILTILAGATLVLVGACQLLREEKQYATIKRKSMDTEEREFSSIDDIYNKV